MTALSFSEACKVIVERAIANAANDAARKERILLARQTGILTDQEARDWIALLEVQAA